MRWKKFELPGELHQSSSAILVIGETQAPACPEDEDCEGHSLTEVVTVEGGGELIMNTDHRPQLQQGVTMHH